MSYKQLTTYDRGRIEVLINEGESLRSIAQKLNVSPSTISRELKRNHSAEGYLAEVAHKKYEKRKQQCGRKIKASPQIVKKVQDHLHKRWSPEQIAFGLFKGALSFKTIYRWIYAKIVDFPETCLHHKGERRKQETRGRFNIGTSISKRPKEVRSRKTFGHWELDTVVSSRGKSKGCFATFAERKTRFYVAIKIPNRTKDSMSQAIQQICNFLPKEALQSFTVDRGKEFACYPFVEKTLDIPVYFADPYSSWQRGTNENSNGLLREFFPKKTNLAEVQDESLIESLELINHRPRKCLDWNSTHEAFMNEVLHLI